MENNQKLETEILLESNESELKEILMSFMNVSCFKEHYEKPNINQNRINEFIEFLTTIKKLIDKSNDGVYNSYIDNIEVDGNSIGVSIVGDEIIFYETKEFAKILVYASNVEIYPRTDEKIAMNFMFYDMID